MLLWTKESLNQPLMVLNKELHKDALKCFKYIQRIMGDRPPGTSWKPSEGYTFLCEQGVNRGEMRDEIYVQIIKQLNKNPSM
jgi:hypothetical protein